MISSDVYSFINIMDKAADASFMRETVIANNIANATTPGYKRQDISFQDSLEHALGNLNFKDINSTARNLDLSRVKITKYTDHPGYSYRLDSNNVDIQTENVELASEQLRYQALTTSISNNFARINTAMTAPT